MAGIFDPTYGAALDPTTSGLLSAAFSALSNSGPSLMPKSTGQILGGAGQAGLQNYQQTRQSNVLLGLEQQKMALANLEYQMKQRGFDIGTNLLQQLGMGGGGVPALSGAAGSPQGSPTAPIGGAAPVAGAPAASGPMALPGAALTLAGGVSGIPAISQLGKMQFDASKGIAQRPGAPITNPMTGEVIAAPAPTPVPGYAAIPDKSDPSGWRMVKVPQAIEGLAAGAGATAGAQAAAKAPYEFENVTLADGRVVPVPKSVLAANGGAPAASVARPLPANVPEADRAAYEAVASGKVPAAYGDSYTPQLVKPQAEGPWATMPKFEQSQGVGQSTLSRGKVENQVSLSKELSTEYGTKAEEANLRKAYNDQALELVDRADVGPGSGFIAGAKNILVERFGVPENDFKNTPSANIALNKDLVNAALQKGRQLFGSRFTQSEVGIMLNKAAPSSEQTRTAIKFLLQSDNAQLGYQINQANDLGKYLGNGGDASKFKGWYAKSFPLSDELAKVQLGRINLPTPPQAAINRLKMNPKEAAQFDEVFGAGSASRVLGK